ncbi:MAG: twin-arginine translocase TatA/TatE family subunit [Pseudomonas sp.]|nr:twin-arginine translocase TatA/TatE family subunit [Pseudomonas sp.]
MGFGGISTWQLVIVAVIILVVFGSKRLRGVGGDVGEAIKGFRKAIKSDDNTTQ